MIKYVIGDATNPVGAGPKLIAHVTNNRGRWGKGFVLSISKKWSLPERLYRNVCCDLGSNQHIFVEHETWVVNMCAQDGFATRSRPVAIDYTALGKCLDALCFSAYDLNATVHCPRIGCGLGGGRWETVEALLNQRLVSQGVPVTVYDLAPLVANTRPVALNGDEQVRDQESNQRTISPADGHPRSQRCG